MKQRMARSVMIVAVLLALAAPAWAADATIGSRVELKATNPLGVPLHREPRPSLFGRIADGTTATVTGLQNEGRWLNLALPDGRAGWIISGYVRQVLPPGPPPPGNDNDAWEVWSSAERCETVVRAGRRMTGARPNAVRVGTWNIRWFPDGDMTPSPSSTPTDLRWLACVITWMNVDLLAVNEIRTTPEAMTAWESVMDGISGLGGGAWHVQLQGCGPQKNQHVGFLWNTTRLTLSDLADVWQFNGAATGPAQPCAGNLRPGNHAYARSVAAGGPSFHAVAVHLDSGRSQRDFDHRQTTFSRLADASAPMRTTDADIIVLGDFNTMGQDGGATATQEIAAMTATVGTAQFDRLPVAPQCTEYFQGEGGWLDHVVAAKAMAELSIRSATVTGYCALANCARLSDPMPPAYRLLSDHCPVVIEVDHAHID